MEPTDFLSGTFLIRAAAVIAAAVLIVVFFFWKLTRYKGYKLPPGPWGLPIVGYIPFLPKDAQICYTYDKLASKYGNIFLIQLGSRTVVVLNSASVIQQVLRLDSAAGRVKQSFLAKTVVSTGEDGIIFQDGPKFRLHRRLGQRAVSPFGPTKESSLDLYVAQSLRWMIRDLANSKGAPVDVSYYYMPCVAAISLAMVFGVPPGAGRSSYETYIEFFKQLTEIAEIVDTLEYLPFLEIFYKKEAQRARNTFSRYADEILKYIDVGISSPSSIISMASTLEKLVQSTPEESKRKCQTSNEAILRALVDIFDGSFFTLSDTLRWAVLLLAKHESAQEKLVEELHSVVGPGQIPSIRHHLNHLHYAKAVFYETLRFVTALPLAIDHRCMEDIIVGDYIIPENATIRPNLWAANRDPELFRDPTMFNPDRFLLNGMFDAAEASKIMAFGYGKRRCPGESVAIQEGPILIAGIIQNFKLILDPATRGDPIRDTVFVFSLHPGPHKIIHEERQPHSQLEREGCGTDV